VASEQKNCPIPVFQSTVFASPARIPKHFDRREREGAAQTGAKENAND
jgi:hypothetical protein